MQFNKKKKINFRVTKITQKIIIIIVIYYFCGKAFFNYIYSVKKIKYKFFINESKNYLKYIIF
jgi:hypothetical protein